MGSTRGRTTTALSDLLFREPGSFSFFQAVRLLERIGAQREESTGRKALAPVGADAGPQNEVVRFRAAATLTFPASEIASLSAPATKPDATSARPAEMEVAFLGLTGPAGALPRHYTSLLIERAHPRHKDRAMRDFFDLFNHRTISLFYRAWEKYRFPIGYEQARRSGDERDDLFTYCLFCLVGLGTDGLRRRFDFDDEAVLLYAGHFAHRPRCAVSLGQLLGDFLRVDAEVRQFQGQWLYLSAADQSSFPAPQCPDGRNLQLGQTAIAGSKVWDVQGKFRIRLGPLTFGEFSQFVPNGRRFGAVCQVTRLYVGPEFDFDVQLILKAAEVPWCQLSGEGDVEPRLGWNTWIRSNEIESDVDDAVFSPTGF